MKKKNNKKSNIMKSTYLIITLIIGVITGYNIALAEFIWPIDRPKRITSTFAEYRNTKFHHGLDISCAGRKGFKIYAAGDGYVSSVMYQQWGIGYAIILRHKNGYFSLYGHMDRFSRSILKNKRVKKYYRHILNRKDFRIDFEKPEIKLRKGVILGYSGDSGRGIEHFHFELRNRDNDPLNPLKFGIRVKDNSAPVIKELFLVPMDGTSHVDGISSEVSFDTVLKNKKKRLYSINEDYLPIIAGKIGIKVKVYDHVKYRSRVAIYGIESYINKKQNYKFVFNRIKKKLSHRMGLYYDFDNSSNGNYTYFLYSRINKHGLIKTKRSGEIIELKIICYDAGNNKSVLKVRFKTGNLLKPANYYYNPNLIPGKPCIFSDRDNKFKIEFNSDSVLYKEMISLKTYKPFKIYLKGLSLKSYVYSIFPTNLFIDKPVLIKIKYKGKDYRKIGIYGITGSKNVYYFVGNDYDYRKKMFYTYIRKAGHYFLVRDKAPPVISFKNKRRQKKGRSLKIYVSDIGAGIDFSSVYLKVDENDVIWDYDPDKHYIEILPHNRIWQKGKHTIVIRIQDRAGNRTKKRIFQYSI